MSDLATDTEQPPFRAAGVPPEPTIAVFVLRALLDMIEGMGIASTTLLEQAGLDAECLAQRDGRVTRHDAERVCELAVRLSGDPALGLHCAERISHRTFAPASHMISYAAGLRQVFDLLDRFAPLFADEPFLALREQGGEACVRMPDLPGQPAAPRRFSAEFRVGSMAHVLRVLCPGLQLTRVTFDYAAPPHRSEYDRVIGHPVTFGQACTAIYFDRALLDAPSPHQDEAALQALRSVAEDRMQRATQPDSCVYRLHTLMMQKAPTRLTMAAAARALGLSERSLRRRLSEEQTSFQKVEYGVLAATARHFLTRDGHSIQETAYKMGFADATAFHRAFKRWTGTTPRALKEQAAR